MSPEYIASVIRKMIEMTGEQAFKHRESLGDLKFLRMFMKELNFGRQVGHTGAIGLLVESGYLGRHDIIVFANCKMKRDFLNSISTPTDVKMTTNEGMLGLPFTNESYETMIFDAVPLDRIFDFLNRKDQPSLAKIGSIVRVGG